MGSHQPRPEEDNPQDPRAVRIRENLARVRGEIATAVQEAERAIDEVTLVAVTKYVGVDEAAVLLKAGCTHLGESRPQELWKKADAEPLRHAEWHLVGHLQRNKVERTLPMVELIHSVDSPRVLTAIERAAAKQGDPARVLLEVNCSGDEAKQGFSPAAVEPLAEQVAACPHVIVDGLMTLAARAGGRPVARRNFAELRELRDRLVEKWPENAPLKHLSMGMSGDFTEAIAEGATIVRIGSALFEGLE